jgi:hypothetical protein
MAIRILLHAIRAAAAPLGRTVEPVVSVFMDFYVRVFVRVWPNRAGALLSCLHTGNVVHCLSCHTFSLQPNGALTHNGRPRVAYAPSMSLRGDCAEFARDGGILYRICNIEYITYNMQYTIYHIQYIIQNILYTIYNI